MTIFYDLLQSSKKDLLKRCKLCYTLVQNKRHVRSTWCTTLLALLHISTDENSIQIRKLLSFVQSIASWLVFPPNSSWTGNSTLLQNTKTLLDLLNLWRRIFLPRPLTLDTSAPFIKEKNNPISATNEDPDWIGSHRFVRFRY